ncbi:MAG: hypothetical protein O3A10_06675 [Chloroflexi bacterium]|nr:hypothetical protein [Chloroflexota bacterium]MDA1147062.1 hypothetical protein [Chloroflexota bacterium]
MIRIRFWRQPQPEALDPEILAVFEQHAHAPILHEARITAVRARVAMQLEREAPRGAGLRQRLAYAAVGGGGLWGTAIGVAAAHKAVVVAAGVGLLLAGGTAAEVSGIGPAVRDAVRAPQATTPHPTQSAIDPTSSPTATAVAAVVASSATPRPGNGATVTDAPEDVPGNLSTHVNSKGEFTLRGVLVAVGPGTIDVQTSVDDVPIRFLLGDARVKIPGNATSGLDAYVGHLLVVSGQCETIGGQLTEDCDVDSVTVLGNAGQSNSGQGNLNQSNPAATGTAEAEPSATPNAPGQSGQHGKPEDPGASEHAGKPDDESSED